MTRTRDTIVSAVIVLCVVLMTATGVIALASDSYENVDNNLVSDEGEFGSHNLQGANVSASTASCDVADVTYVEDIDSNSAFASGHQISYLGSAGLDSASMVGDFCLRNFGSQPAVIDMQFVAIVDTEVSCSPGESTFDATCGSGAGELSQALIFDVNSIVPHGGTSDEGSCGPYTDIDFGTKIFTFGFLLPGEVCRFYISVRGSDTASEAQMAAAQTDDVTWVMQFDAHD